MKIESLTTKEVAELLAISNQMVYNLIKSEELCAFRVGKAVRVLASDLESYINHQKALYKGENATYQSKSDREYSVQNLCARLASFSLNGLSFSFPKGQTLAVLGPSGSGKTLLLRALAGLVTLEQGAIFNGAERVDTKVAGSRRIGFVFQDYALYPMMDSQHNLAFPHLIRHMDKHDIAQKVEEVIAKIKLPNLYRTMKPEQLPEGIKQLVAIGHAQSVALDTYIMDEPLSHLDIAEKKEMRLFLKSLVQEFGKTTIYAFNDPADALSLSDWILILDGGSMVQFGPTLEVYRKPANIAAMEALSAYGTNQVLVEVLHGLTRPWGCAVAEAETGQRILAFRPDEVEVGPIGKIRAKIIQRRHIDGIHELVDCQAIHGDNELGQKLQVLVPTNTSELFDFSPRNPHYFKLDGA